MLSIHRTVTSAENSLSPVLGLRNYFRIVEKRVVEECGAGDLAPAGPRDRDHRSRWLKANWWLGRKC